VFLEAMALSPLRGVGVWGLRVQPPQVQVVFGLECTMYRMVCGHVGVFVCNGLNLSTDVSFGGDCPTCKVGCRGVEPFACSCLKHVGVLGGDCPKHKAGCGGVGASAGSCLKHGRLSWGPLRAAALAQMCPWWRLNCPGSRAMRGGVRGLCVQLH
jgi:hypothetical protein